jgi:hypothetical protein
LITSGDIMQSTRCEVSSQDGLMKTDARLMKTDNHGRPRTTRPVSLAARMSLAPPAADWPGTTRLPRMGAAGVGK